MVLLEQTATIKINMLEKPIKFLISTISFLLFFLLIFCFLHLTNVCLHRAKKKQSNIPVRRINMDMCTVQWMLMQQHYSLMWIIRWNKCARLIERKGTWYSKQIKCAEQITEIGVNVDAVIICFIYNPSISST